MNRYGMSELLNRMSAKVYGMCDPYLLLIDSHLWILFLLVVDQWIWT